MRTASPRPQARSSLDLTACPSLAFTPTAYCICATPPANSPHFVSARLLHRGRHTSSIIPARLYRTSSGSERTSTTRDPRLRYAFPFPVHILHLTLTDPSYVEFTGLCPAQWRSPTLIPFDLAPYLISASPSLSSRHASQSPDHIYTHFPSHNICITYPSPPASEISVCNIEPVELASHFASTVYILLGPRPPISSVRVRRDHIVYRSDGTRVTRVRVSQGGHCGVLATSA
ncbi:hypothetical protein BV20DRAFT_92197 [Pilatotrama ljubarskyi]|nr:hypothetical protein BV20DRAFT_92197 [Pilatotrama ljubarskyi]